MFSRIKKSSKQSPRHVECKRAARARGETPRQHIEALEVRQLLSAAVETVTPSIIESPSRTSASVFAGYTPAEIRAAYGFTGVSANGAGQTIAIVDAYRDPNIASDVAVFDKEYGLPSLTLNQYNQSGGSIATVQDNSSWASEIALDVEWAHAIAPDATIDLVEASNDSITNLLAAASEARSLSGVSVVSMSWGGSEFRAETADDKDFTTPTGHMGVTFVAASGDEGAGAEWPASSPDVLAVGGTTLNLTSTGTYSSEIGWTDSSGGASGYETTPSYQKNANTGAARTTPDVSYDADPNTGLAVYDSYGSGGWTVYGGTSAGTPQWAALIALADQERVAAGKGTLDGATGTLPALYALYSGGDTSSTYTAAFNDITSMDAVTRGFGDGGFGGGGFGGGGWGHRFARGHGGFGFASANTTTAGYDEVTGLGSPKATDVVAALVNYNAPTTTTATTGMSRAERRRLQAAAASAAARPALARERNTIDEVTTLATPPKATIPSTDSQLSASLVALMAETSTSTSTQGVAKASSDTATTNGNSAAASTTQNPSHLIATMVETPIRTATLLMPVIESTPIAKMISSTIELVRIDAVTALGNAASLFANDALDANLTGNWTDSDSRKAWGITLSVLAADAVLIGHWRRRRKEAGSQRAVDSDFSLVPITSESK